MPTLGCDSLNVGSLKVAHFHHAGSPSSMGSCCIPRAPVGREQRESVYDLTFPVITGVKFRCRRAFCLPFPPIPATHQRPTHHHSPPPIPANHQHPPTTTHPSQPPTTHPSQPYVVSPVCLSGLRSGTAHGVGELFAPDFVLLLDTRQVLALAVVRHLHGGLRTRAYKELVPGIPIPEIPVFLKDVHSDQEPKHCCPPSAEPNVRMAHSILFDLDSHLWAGVDV